MFSTPRSAFVACVAAVVSLAVALPAPVPTDDFNDNSTNASLWKVSISGSGPTITEVNQRVEAVIPSSSTGSDLAAAYNGRCAVSGDYDVQVDYLLLGWPAANGVRVTLASIPGGLVERISFGAGDHTGSPPEVYLRDFGASGGEAGITATSDLSGKLRLNRTGSTLTPYYYSSGTWVALPSGTTSTAPAFILFQAFTQQSFFSHQNVTVAFDNYVLNQGAVSCPICTAAPATESSVLGINGTVTGGASGIAAIALAGGSSNLTLTVPAFTPGASPVTFRAVQTDSSLNAQGTVVGTDQVGSSCTVPVTFKVRTAGPASNETLCAADTGEGYLFKATSTVSQPAGTSACSGHLAMGEALPLNYSFTSAASHILTIRSPIAGSDTQMELTQQGAFDASLRLMFSRSDDGGTTFSPFTDVTTSTATGSTIIRGKGQWSDVKAVAARTLGTPGVSASGASAVPALGRWGVVIMSLLLMAASAVLLARRQRAPRSTTGKMPDNRADDRS